MVSNINKVGMMICKIKYYFIIKKKNDLQIFVNVKRGKVFVEINFNFVIFYWFVEYIECIYVRKCLNKYQII